MSRSPRHPPRRRAGSARAEGEEAAEAAATARRRGDHGPDDGPHVVWESASGQCRVVRWVEPTSNAWYISPEISDGTDLMGQKRWKRVTLYYNQLPPDLVSLLNELITAAREMTRGLAETIGPAELYDDAVVQ